MSAASRTCSRGAAPASAALGRAALIALAVLAGSAGFARRAAAADEDDWGRIPVPESVAAGETITLEIGEAPRDVEEMEVLLSLDDGRTFPVRVTREIEAGERELRWKVPALATRAARLRIRFGGDRGREEWGPLSAPFAIVTHGEAADLRLFHENGWWEGLDGPAPRGPAGEFDSAGPRFVPGGTSGEAALPTTPPSLAARAPARMLRVLASAAPAAPATPDRTTIDERHFPLRN